MIYKVCIVVNFEMLHFDGKFPIDKMHHSNRQTVHEKYARGRA